MTKPEEDIIALMNKFGLFTSKDARFDRDESSVEKCIDPRLKEKARHLFKALGFEKEVILPLEEMVVAKADFKTRLTRKKCYIAYLDSNLATRTWLLLPQTCFLSLSKGTIRQSTGRHWV
jgi:hypothetical protein